MTNTITMPRSVVEQALQSLHLGIAMYPNGGTAAVAIQATIDALRAALEQPPVNSPEIPKGWKLVPVEPTRGMCVAGAMAGVKHEDVPYFIYLAMLAAAPQPPVVEQPQGEQEPVMWMNAKGRTTFDPCRASCWRDSGPVTPLYTRPQPKRQPLTDEQINNHRLALPYDGEDLPDPWDFKQGVKAAERAHGIGGEV